MFAFNARQDAAIDEAVARLALAAETRVQCASLSDVIDADDTASAYEIQRRSNSRRAQGAARVIGRKVGLTSAPAQARLGASSPDYGVLFDDMRMDGRPTSPGIHLFQPMVEVEIAFVLARDVDGDFSPAALREAVDYVSPALEIADTRILNWDITLADTIADNGSAGAFVLGTDRRRLTDFEPRDARMSLRINSEVASEGSGIACLGDPVNALMWLAKAVAEAGDPLRAGEIILSGSLGPMAPARAGDAASATIVDLGTVSVVL